MEQAIALGTDGKPLRLRDMLEIHRVLMLATTTPQVARKLREHQNWIGGNAHTPAAPISSRPRPSG